MTDDSSNDLEPSRTFGRRGFFAAAGLVGAGARARRLW